MSSFDEFSWWVDELFMLLSWRLLVFNSEQLAIADKGDYLKQQNIETKLQKMPWNQQG